jgi:hypothetical protein
MNAQMIPQPEQKARAMLPAKQHGTGRHDVAPELRRTTTSTCHVEAFGEVGLVTSKPLAKSEDEDARPPQ